MNTADAYKVIAEIHRRAECIRPLEQQLTRNFGLPNPTPLQRAVCRIIDGQPLGELKKHPDIIEAIGDVSKIKGKPKEVWLIAGIRTAKSLIAAAAAWRMTQTCAIEHLGSGEDARVGVVSLDRDKAKAVYNHFVGNIKASPFLRPSLLDEVASENYALVRHPSGRRVEFLVLAGSKAGGSLVSRWMAGVVFDEAARMAGRSEGVVNLEDMRTAVLGRLLDGAQILYPSSPWAPYGPAYDAVSNYWKHPKHGIVVIKARAPLMNPVWWTPERIEAIRDNPKSHDTYVTDVSADFLALLEHLFTEAITQPNVKTIDPKPQPGWSYSAAMDPATRSNAWTMIVAGCSERGKKQIVHAQQWQGSQAQPLKSKQVFREMQPILRRYKLDTVSTDQWAFDSLREHADQFGITLVQRQWTSTEAANKYLKVRDELIDNRIDLPDMPELIADLKRVQRKATPQGLSIVLPLTEDGRHCDYVPALVRAVDPWLDEPAAVPPPPNTAERANWDADKDEEEEDEEYDRMRRMRSLT